MAEFSPPARPFRRLSTVVLAVAGVVFALSWRAGPPQWSLPLVLLALAAVLSENYAVDTKTYTISLAYPLAMAAMVLAGPTSVAIVAALTAVSIADIRNKTEPGVMCFNVGQLLLVPIAGGWIYLALGGSLLWSISRHQGNPLVAADFPGALVPLLSAAAMVALGNVAILGLGIATTGGKSLRSSVGSLLWFVPSQLALALVGFLIAQVIAVNWIALPLFVAPLLVARQLYQRYASLKEAYADTVRSLIGALEAKDPYTRGHSERVAEYALELGACVGLDSRTLERLEYAALLHDLGKLAVPSKLLTKPGALTDEETDSVQLHAVRGAEMVAKIPPLKDLADSVRHHHEWYDGGGYPLRVRGSMIPHLALILCVADSYDAMTSTRSYRPALTSEQATAELISGAGSQFDPDLVRAFIEGRAGYSRLEVGSSREADTGRIPLFTQGGRV